MGKVSDIAFNLIDIMTFVSSLLTVISISVGVWLLISALSFYKIHRSTPKAVPLWQPFGFVLFGLALIGLPFVGDFVGGTSDPNPDRTQAAEARQKKIDDKRCKKKYMYQEDNGTPVEEYVCSDTESFYD